MGQEPGTESEIQEFCQLTYDVQFPLFQKISVKGEQQHPLYHFLTEAKPKTDISNGSEFADKLAGYGQMREKDGDILWNFEKFLIGKNGEVVSRIAPDVAVDNADVVKAVEAEIGK